jgi:hypothetical protein
LKKTTTKHLVTTLRKSEQIAFKNELVQRMRIAKAVLKETAEEDGVDPVELSPHVIAGVIYATYKGIGFATEEVRGMRSPAPRSRAQPSQVEDIDE